MLPLGASLARKLGSAVTLLHVIERDAPAAIHGDRHLTNAVEAEQYLEDLSRRYFGDTEEVELHVHTDVESNVARSIVDHARERASELVLLCTHGRGGLRHRLFGGIAQRVLAIPSKRATQRVINYLTREELEERARRLPGLRVPAAVGRVLRVPVHKEDWYGLP